MNFLDSLRSYYRENKLSRLLANGFFLLILLGYLLPAILALSGSDQLASKFLNFRSTTLGLDSIISLPLILVFMRSYTLSILDNKTLGSLYSIILILNLGFLIFGILMSGTPFSARDLLLVLPFIFLIFLRVPNKPGKNKIQHFHNINHLSALISIVLPLFLLGLIGKFAFSFIV